MEIATEQLQWLMHLLEGTRHDKLNTLVSILAKEQRTHFISYHPIPPFMLYEKEQWVLRNPFVSKVLKQKQNFCTIIN